MSYALRCPHCRKKFPWDPMTEKPNKCKLCGEPVGGNIDNDGVVMPFIRSAKTTATDKIYRDMERGSEVRAERAAELTGSSVSDMAALKITNMNDGMRAGDVAIHREADAAMARIQATTKAPVGFAQNGSEYASGVSTGAISINGQIVTGIEPNAGAKVAQRVQRIMQGL